MRGAGGVQTVDRPPRQRRRQAPGSCSAPDPERLHPSHSWRPRPRLACQVGLLAASRPLLPSSSVLNAKQATWHGSGLPVSCLPAARPVPRRASSRPRPDRLSACPRAMPYAMTDAHVLCPSAAPGRDERDHTKNEFYCKIFCFI